MKIKNWQEDSQSTVITPEVYTKADDMLTRAQFEEEKANLENVRKNKNQQQSKALAHAGIDLKDHPFLHELATREEDIRNGKKTTILFIRYEEKDDARTKNEEA